MLADAIDQQDQPSKGLPFRGGKVGAAAQACDHRPEIGPTLIKVDQVARHGRNVLTLPLPSPGVFFERTHEDRLTHVTLSCGVK